MLNWFKLFIIMAFINTGCSAQKNMLEKNIETAGNKQSIEDSILQKLQSENDLVIAYAIENFAWVRSIDYHIIARNNNEWKGCVYHKNLMMGNAGTPTSITAINVNKSACDSFVNYISENKAWTIKGDLADGFCTEKSKKCNINDAPSARLWIITKTSAINPSYYAPEFFEKCCPGNQQRSLFLSITKKISNIVGEPAATE